MSTLKGIIEDIKQQEEKKLYKMSTKFEFQKNELIKNYEEQMEKRENFYLLEINNLARKLEQQASRDKDKLACAEEEIRNLKYHLKDLENVFLEKENDYLKMSKSRQGRANKEVQCGHNPQRTEKTVQAGPDISVADSQTSQEFPQQERYEQRISFLQEQNEVLKFIIKDLKKNRESSGQPPGCECLTVRADVEQVNNKFESEINNLKKILEKELKVRAEEDAVIQNLELNVTCLKDKLLLGLQEKLRQFSGNDICGYIYSREIQSEVQVSLLEQKLYQKINSFMTAAAEDRQKVHQELEELRKECFRRMDTYLKPRAINSEYFLEQIRMEIEKLENRIETNLRNIMGNNCGTEKCYKNAVQEDARGGHLMDCFWPEGASQHKGKQKGEQRVPKKFINNLMVGR